MCQKCSHLFQRVASFLLCRRRKNGYGYSFNKVLISFREWLHSYWRAMFVGRWRLKRCSHLFQRVASFLLTVTTTTMTTTRSKFSSLSESGFIPTIFKAITERIQKAVVLISFREWLHSYMAFIITFSNKDKLCSHLFQRVASFLHIVSTLVLSALGGFSSLSESGFIPTLLNLSMVFSIGWGFSSLSESGFIPTWTQWWRQLPLRQ